MLNGDSGTRQFEGDENRMQDRGEVGRHRWSVEPTELER